MIQYFLNAETADAAEKKCTVPPLEALAPARRDRRAQKSQYGFFNLK
jgi:hypothetical protein